MTDPNFKARYNPSVQQFKNTECGIFSMLFLKLCLENKNKQYRSIRKQIPVDRRDNKIHEHRELFYR